MLTDGETDTTKVSHFFFFAILLKYLNNTGINKDNTYKSEGDTNQN